MIPKYIEKKNAFMVFLIFLFIYPSHTKFPTSNYYFYSFPPPPPIVFSLPAKNFPKSFFPPLTLSSI